MAHELRNLKPPLISRTIQKAMASLLEQIELTRRSDGWSDVGQEVLAARLDVSVKSVYRHLQLAGDLQFLETAPGEALGSCRLIRPNWPAVETVCRSRGGFRAPQRVKELLPDNPGEPIRKEVRRDFLSDPTGQLSGAPSTIVESLNKDTIYHLPSTITDGEKSLVTQRPDNCPVRPDIFSLPFESLANADRLDEWLSWAVAVGKARSCDRFRIFAQARSTWRRSKEAQKSGRPMIGVGAFLANVQARRWFASQADEDWARSALRYLDRQESGL